MAMRHSSALNFEFRLLSARSRQAAGSPATHKTEGQNLSAVYASREAATSYRAPTGLARLLKNWREQVGQTFLSATSASFCWPEMPKYLLGRLESLPHDFFSSLLVPVDTRFDTYPAFA